MKSLYQATGYKFRWVKRRTIIDGAQCDKCKLVFPEGSEMYIYSNKWTGTHTEILCPACKGGR